MGRLATITETQLGQPARTRLDNHLSGVLDRDFATADGMPAGAAPTILSSGTIGPRQADGLVA